MCDILNQRIVFIAKKPRFFSFKVVIVPATENSCVLIVNVLSFEFNLVYHILLINEIAFVNNFKRFLK